MKNVTERTLAFLLSLLLFLSSSSLVSLFGKNTGGLVGEAKAEGEEGEEPTPTLPEGVPAGYHEYDLYNFIHVNGAGQDTGFGRLRLTKIYTKDTMETYHSLSLESSEPYLIPEGEYKYYPEVYDFSAEGNRVITLQTTQSGNKKYEGVYLLFDYYLNELKNGNTIDLSSPKMDGFFLVKGTERSPRYFQNKIGGSSFGWVYPDMAGQSSSARPCFHCDYLIEVSKIVDLPVYNLLGVTGRDFTEHNTGKYYRLSDRNTAITLPFLFDFDSVIGEKKTIDPSGEYYRVLLPESDDYNFNNLQLTFNIDGVDYTFSYQPDSNYVPNSPTFEPYYTVELEGISYSDSIHGDPDWYGNTNGWLGDETHPEWPSSNSTPSYHRNYKATLHREGDTHSIKFYGSDDKTIPPIDNHQQVIGSKTTFNGASLPTKDGDAEYNYVFSGWKNSRGVIFSYTDSVNNELPNVGRNEEYTPVFTAISKRITITAASDEWTYDGSAHVNTTVTVTSGELLPGDTLVAEATGSVTKVSDTSSENNPIAEGYKIMHGTEDVTYNYVITPHAGTLTINPKPVTITAKSEEFTYDGNAHSNSGYDVVGLVGDDAISAVVTGSITYPSQSPVTNVLTSYEFTSGTAGNYSVTTANGQLTMTNASIAITITAASQVWTYDGSAHENTTVTVTSGSLLTGDRLEATATGSVTNVADTSSGNNPIAEGYKIMHGTEDVTANYAITTEAGTLTINPKPVTITANSEAFTYDGNPHSNDGYVVVGLLGSDAISPAVTGSITFPSESPVTNKVSSYEFTSGTAGNYTVTTVDGELTMTNASVAITITAASQAWTYDGSAHSNTAVTVTSGTLLTGDSLVAEATGSVTDVSDTATGNNPIAAGYKIMHGDEDVTDNYVITPVAGTLTINPKAVTVTAKSEEFTYDGTAHSNSGYDVVGVVGDDAISAVVTGSITFPNESPVTNKVESYEFTSGTAGNYTVTTVDGKLTMTNAGIAITITAASQEWTYDGNAHTNNVVTVTSGSLSSGDELVATATGSVTNVADTATGNNPIAAGYKIMHGDEDVTANYAITTEAGTLKINPRNVRLASASNEKVYDGTPLTNSNVYVSGDGFAAGEGATYSVTGYQMEVGSSTNTFFYTLNEGTKADNYTISTVEGTLIISPITDAVTVTIIGNTGTVAYDGDEHSYFGYVVSIDHTLYTENDFLFSGTAIAKGTDAGIYLMGLTADQFVNANGNFSNVTFEINNDGYLTINPKAITITAKDQTYTYDGTIQGPAGTYTDSFDTYVTIEGLVGSDSLTSITLTGSATVAGTYSNAIVPSAALIGNKTDNYSISYANGTLRINKCTITIQAENQTKVYDNDPATDPTLTSMVSGVPVDGVVPAYTLSRAAGQNVGEYVISVNLGDNPNYDITASDGTLTISQKEAVLAWTDTEFYYDGKSHIPTATVSNLVDGDTCEVTAEGAQTEAGDSYTATATALSNPNYKLPADATTTFKIIGFTITFVDEDGTPLQSGIVAYGTKPAYTGKTPTKAATAQYTYEFLDWSPTITEVDGDKTYTATYKPILNEYTVTWKDEDGTVLETDEKVPYGTMPTYNGKEPTKASTAEYSYKFDGWSIKVAEVTGDITYTATYAATLNEYTVEASNLPEGVQLSFSGKETVEAGKVLTFTVNVLDGYDKTDDFVVTVNGTKLEPDSNGIYTIPNILRDTLISVSGVQKVDYNIAEGDNAKYTQGALGVGRFVFKRTVNDKVTFGRFTYAELDGKVLDPNNYTKASGSLIIELKKEFMATLPVGEHLLKVHFSDDTEGVIAHFFIEAAATDPSVTTGDTSAPILWIILLAAALLGLLGVIYSKSRQAAR